MANEHTLVIQKTLPVPFTVADGTAITKGAVLKLTDPNTASTATAADDLVAGIAATSKIASDGRTSLAVITGPGDEFTAKASGTITAGDPIAITSGGGGFNYVKSVKGTAASGIKRLGFAKTTVTDDTLVRYELDRGEVVAS